MTHRDQTSRPGVQPCLSFALAFCTDGSSDRMTGSVSLCPVPVYRVKALVYEQSSCPREVQPLRRSRRAALLSEVQRVVTQQGGEVQEHHAQSRHRDLRRPARFQQNSGRARGQILTTLGATHVGHNVTSQFQYGFKTCLDSSDLRVR